MRYSELKRELTRLGCIKRREGKRHEIWFSPLTGKNFTVPRHDQEEVPAGTLKSIRKDAGSK
ncbi:MAG: type II toxin-antitoxin system HicA family toxin [Acutalibacter sp.]|nr:type II toxin-antitoxin system HicA family toxin [Acutalibacter sp.]